MKHFFIITALLFILPLSLFAQNEEEEETIMYETVMLTPALNYLQELQDAMQEHNRTFHNTAPYTAYVFSIVTGPDTGKMMWVMGALSSYAELDDRPSSDAHAEHWQTEVLPHIAEVGTGEYWYMDQELSNNVEGEYSLHFMRHTKINQDYTFLIRGALEKISETVKAMDGDNPWTVWWNAFQQGDLGRHYMVDWPMENWAELDEDGEFRETFEEVHGKQGWDDWSATMDLVIEDGYDEIWEFRPDLSAETE